MASQYNNNDGNVNNLITYKIICGALAAILATLLTILGFLFSNWMSNQQKTNEKILQNTDSMNSQLVQVRLKITQLENKMLTTQTVRMIAREEINNYHSKNHGQ